MTMRHLDIPVSRTTVVTRSPLNHEALADKARKLRVETLKMTHAAGSGHPGGSFSMAEMIVELYYNRLNVSPDNLRDPNRDIFILSKGHCAPGLYAVLGDLGFFDESEYPRLRRLGGLLQGHVDRKIPGIEMSTGSLGMGLGYGNGVALIKKLDNHAGRVYVMLGDGELQEGNVWESAMTSAHRNLDNLTVIVDHNKIQIDGFVEDVKRTEPITDKFAAFGFHIITCNGHDFASIQAALDQAEAVTGQPTCIVMETEKGHGVSFMTLKADYHGRCLKDDEMVTAMAELGEAWTPDSAQ